MNHLPVEMVHKICEYDGRIKYRKGKYIDVLHKRDKRYAMVEKIIEKKCQMAADIEVDGDAFYFCVSFDNERLFGLSYDYHFSYENIFFICYYDFRREILRIRTIL